MPVNPDIGGQSFIPSSYAKVRQIKTLVGKRPVEISVDGGVNRDKAGPLVQAGATILVAGSAVFGAENPAQAVKDLRSTSEALKYAWRLRLSRPSRRSSRSSPRECASMHTSHKERSRIRWPLCLIVPWGALTL